ncbi:hypothetical protein QNE33_004767 [Vibrio alginolyticus]|uniref:hypothetical protein n=1 Tax=Vibrio alginolyticus TaxID=663 RepID=UPI00215FA802|nr:hypothetical protein [Vibrio alginolyticus]EJS0324557.1 hypothetical protein [Vibrio alginolyticus]ELB2909222.1 hypothetical protein [Vibrio alginolyticus]ELW1398521.1 hypothetical protein [Vibrio alginolyticus]MCS0279247.1 hypothetical protein [Vibrio alginolyticus]
MPFKSSILCVFEGEIREPKYFDSLKSCFFSEDDIFYCCYGNDLYELFDLLEEDDDLNIFDIIKENNTVSANQELFENHEADDFNQVFMFFDFEYHDDKFDIEKITKMITLFDDETLHGKIFISYPMIESIRDIPSPESFLEHKVCLDDTRGKIYKGLSAQGISDYVDPRKIDDERWKRLVRLSVEKANYMISGDVDKFDLTEQIQLLGVQIKEMKSNVIFVLCSFPMFVHHQKAEQLGLSS